MSDESRRPARPLRDEEKAILAALLGKSPMDIDIKLQTAMVEDMTDGGMGSIRFLREGAHRSFGAVVAGANYVDSDGVTVTITVNVDEQGDLFEVDFWKVDFSPLREYPVPGRLRAK